ncbi:hypothetical protein BFL35_08685 [Clavibacter michiganensis]|nr:hypothetical protein BFL35_08685 [Clavibacter michiganensis]
MIHARAARPLLALAVAGLSVALVGCTAPAPSDDATPAPAPSSRPAPTDDVTPQALTSPAPIALEPVEIGTGDAISVATGRRAGRLAFTDLGPAGTDIRLTGFGDVPQDLGLVLLDEFEPKRGCLPDVFDTSSWQPDLVRDANGDHVAHEDRRGDTMGNPAEFPHAMAIIRDPVLPDSDVAGRAKQIEEFQAEAAKGCIFPTVFEAELTWHAR